MSEQPSLADTAAEPPEVSVAKEGEAVGAPEPDSPADLVPPDDAQ